jgi:hypothetical protein
MIIATEDAKGADSFALDYMPNVYPDSFTG